MPTFDGENLLIILDPGITDVDAEIDLYSDWKEWFKTGGNSKYPLAFRTIGGDDLGGGLEAGAYFFLQNQNGWRIRPDEADHELKITGNLYGEDASLPLFVPTLGEYTVLIAWERSSLTQEARPEAEWTQAEKDQIFADVDKVEADVAGVKDDVDEVKHNPNNPGSFDPDTDALEAIRDRGDEAWKTATRRGASFKG